MKATQLLSVFNILFSAMIIPFNGSSQNKEIDSLRTIVLNGKVDHATIIIYRELGTRYVQQGKFDSAIYHYKSGITKSRALKSDYWEAKYLLWTAGIFTMATVFDSASHYFDIVYPLLPSLKNDSLQAQFYQNKGTLFMYQNKPEQAADFMIRSIEIMERMKNPPMNLLMSAYMNISGIFNGLKQPGKAVPYDRKVLTLISKATTPFERSLIYINVANTYFQLDELETMKKYLDTARSYQQRYPNPRAELSIQGAYGLYFEKTNRNDSALHYMQQAVAISKKSGDFYYFTEHAINLANVRMKMGQLSAAENLLQEVLPYAQEFVDYFILAETYKGLKEISEKKGNYKKALEYGELSNRFADSAQSSENRKNILSLEAKYENQRKEAEIAALQLSNKEKELAVFKRNRLLLIGGISTSAVILLLGLLYRNSAQKRMLSEKDKRLKEEKIRFLERQQQVVSLQSMINGQETERTRIAKDLHDGLGGLFSTIKMYFSSLQHEKAELEEEPLFKKSYELVHTASEEVRRIAHNMMPEVLLKIGLVQATRELCAGISAGKLLQVSFQSYGMEQRLNASTEIMLYRILQELLNNIMKHAQATEAIIQFNREGNRLSITVEDNGKGFNLNHSDEGNHSGLSSVQNRVQYLNGKLSIDSQNEMGTTVLMDFLINESKA